MKYSSLLLVVALGAACASKDSGRLIDKVQTPPTSEREVRAYVLEYARHWNGVVEEAADEIALRAPGSALRCDAMRWKIDAVGACEAAATRTDPIAALIDVWALAMQMVDYLESGAGKDRFGPEQDIALTAARNLEADAANMIQDEATRERTRGTIADWVAANPVPRSLMNRPSTMPVLAAMAGDQYLSAMATIRSADQKAGDLMQRLEFYIEVLPEGLRWQMEYVVERHLLSQEEKRTLLAQVNVMASSLEPVGALSRDLPALMDKEREQIQAVVNEQRGLVFADIERERKAILADVTQQREALVADVGAQRDEIMAGLREQQDKAFASVAEERKAVLAAVDEQRRETLAEIERLTRLAVAESGDKGRDTIDHFFARAALFGGGLVALLFVAGLAFVKLARKR